MPGIAGIIGNAGVESRQRIIEEMVASMVHESFYVSGVYRSERMASDIGWSLHEGSFADCNPVWNEGKDICLLFAGEEFTDRDDWVHLKKKGYQFDPYNASRLVCQYEEHGIDVFRRWNGFYAGVLLDFRNDHLILFNDRYGLGRIYLHEREGCIYFSSEAKSLLRVLPELRDINAKALAEFCTCGCALGNRTLFSGIYLLPPASVWTYSQGKLASKATYFTSAEWEQQSPLGEREYYDCLKDVFSRILPKYFEGGRPVGMSLTGGLDGKMIMAWADRGEGELPCYTFGGPYRDCTDVTYARAVAKKCGQSHRVLEVNGEFLGQFAEMARKAVFVSDGAMDVTGSVELFVNRTAREIAPVRMTGNYGSEVLRGNVAFKPSTMNDVLFSPDLCNLGRIAAETYAAEARMHPTSFIAFKQVPWHHHSRLAVEQSQVTMRSPYLDHELVALSYRAPGSCADGKELALRLIEEGAHNLGRIPTDRGLVSHPLPVAGKIRNLYQELTFRAEYAFDYGMPQWLARLNRVVAPFQFEKFFLGRHKFYHFRVWYRDYLGPYLKEVLLDSRSRSRSYLQGAKLENMLNEHIGGVRNYTTELHQALSLELIHRELLD